MEIKCVLVDMSSNVLRKILANKWGRIYNSKRCIITGAH